MVTGYGPTKRIQARGSWNSFSTAQFSANSLDESDLEELLDEEVAPARCKGPDPKSLERGGKHTGLVIKAHAFTICFELF